MRLWLGFWLALLPGWALAQDWQFDAREVVTEVASGKFIHLDASGRRSIAVGPGHVAVTWEDNRSGRPTVYVAFRDLTEKGFTAARAVSDGADAYEPAIAALDEDHFVIGWEQADGIWLRVVSPRDAGDAVALTQAPARQISFSDKRGKRVAMVWAERHERYLRIAQASVTRDGLRAGWQGRRWVDNSTDRKQQLYPAVTRTENGITVAWEDRREGATRIYTAFAPSGKAFGDYRLLNDFIESPNPELGHGTGAMRVGLASSKTGRVIAAWLDKRHFVGGYDVYAAFSDNGGRRFEADEKVQDLLGENMPQWHAAVAMAPHSLATVAWDDERDGTPDVWFSWKRKSQWSDDFILAEAGGPHAQRSPALAFDELGRLHAVWLSRDETGSRLHYARGRALP